MVNEIKTIEDRKQSLIKKGKTNGYFHKAGLCGGWTGKTDDDLSENLCGIQSGGSSGSYDKKYHCG